MAISVLSCSYVGVESYVVEVEVDISNGLPVFNIVGMGDVAIIESRERIRSCFKNLDIDFPVKRVLINLSPADVKKKGSHFDLPIFLGILVNIDYISNVKKLKDYLVLGEISLNGNIKSVKGVINAAILAKEKGLKGIVVPSGNYLEASLISGIDIVPVSRIPDIISFFGSEDESGKIEEQKNAILKMMSRKTRERLKNKSEENTEQIDFSDVRGQFLAKRALEISASGGHNIFLIGDPGSGKSMLAKRFTTILPEMTEEEIIETTKIYSISGMLNDEEPIVVKRPFRSPHHTATQTALVGGAARVGEITLALNGVFFLDELGEFGMKTLETLREPLEDGKITISRANSIMTYPVRTIAIMASNPTSCGYFPDDPQCTDSLRDIKNYRKKFSGPLLDRIDLFVEMRRLTNDEIFGCEISENSEEIRKRVKKARKIQKNRYKSNIILNTHMTQKQIEKYCKLDRETENVLKQAVNDLKLSVRMYHKILKTARTIADLESSENIEMEHILEALSYRKKY